MTMERARLETLSLEELRQKALRYQLPVTASSDKNLLIEVIISHLEQNSSFEEMMPPAQRSRAPSGARSRKGSGQADLPGPSTMSAPTG
ncbi:rho termination factor domain-containing protein [Lasius niger]|uniref:Rho termination factor domain-containing protein n=1 Tax=Lasius niger TaxID=67767 RepID=A0A0J7KG41_LASNI|nr:rho termination factor domain-containing protein [Lasius niger]KMQ89168.1 rho termination factor domain-containing protein [Lasius niger]KMQ89753.1 rho termination factor domain-containing protein [Lasius niger]